MRIHHLNCGSMCPLATPELVCHCLLLELSDRLVLVDAGYGEADVRSPQARLGRLFPKVAAPTLKLEETARAQLGALGFDPRDVRDIVLTHMDIDHVGGISDFPWARVHVTERERRGVMGQGTRTERRRYETIRWAREAQLSGHTPGGEPWFGFECVRDMPGLPPELLLVPLPGHTPGHAGVAIERREGWLLHCGDAYFYHGQMAEPYHCPATLSLFQLGGIDHRARRHNLERLRQLARDRSAEVTLFCAHDRHELLRLKG